jgi:hypothetical protein
MHRERDRPKAVSARQWNWIIDFICLKLNVPFETDALEQDLHDAVPQSRGKRLSEITEVEAAHWIWERERLHPTEKAQMWAQRGLL